MKQLGLRQQIWLWIAAAIIGLALATLLNASLLGSVGLVAAVGILLGMGAGAWELWQRSRRST